MNIDYSKLIPECDTCPELDLDVDVVNLHADNKVVDRVITVTCANKHICDNIKKHLTK